MRRVVDAASIALLLSAAGAFTAGIHALGAERDLAALYWLVVGGLLLRSASDLLRPRPDAR